VHLSEKAAHVDHMREHVYSIHEIPQDEPHKNCFP